MLDAELLQVLNELPAAIEKAFTAFIEKHPGHGNQKTHGRRGDGGQTADASEWYLSQQKPSYAHPGSSMGGYTATQTRENFEKVASKLEAQTGVGKETIREYFNDWGKEGGHGEKYKELQGMSGKLSQQIHANTQAEFKKAGITEVTLYRGDSGSKSNLESWTLDQKAAERYAKRSGGEVKKETFSIDKIVSTPFTGFGNIGDFEFVVKRK